MKKATFPIGVLFFILLFCPLEAADKFQSSFKTTPIKETIQPSAIKTTKPSTTAQPAFSTPSIQAIPEVKIKSIGKALPNYQPSKYEQQYMDMMAAQALEAVKKKKTLVESIIGEMATYGLYLVIAIVIFVAIQAVRREHKKPAGPPTSPFTETPSTDEPKKDIWSDEF